MLPKISEGTPVKVHGTQSQPMFGVLFGVVLAHQAKYSNGSSSVPVKQIIKIQNKRLTTCCSFVAFKICWYGRAYSCTFNACIEERILVGRVLHHTSQQLLVPLLYNKMQMPGPRLYLATPRKMPAYKRYFRGQIPWLHVHMSLWWDLFYSVFQSKRLAVACKD